MKTRLTHEELQKKLRELEAEQEKVTSLRELEENGNISTLNEEYIEANEYITAWQIES